MRLSDDDTALFFRLMWQLQFFVNQQLGILPKVRDAEKYARLPQDDKLKVRDALWEHGDLIDTFVAQNPARLPPDELAIVQSWRGFVAGHFLIERYLKKGAIFVSAEEPVRVYLVLALYDEFSEMLPAYVLPSYVQTVLLPFRERIIYDGLLVTQSVMFGSNMRSSFRETYMRAKQRGEIIESLGPATSATPIPAHSTRPAQELGPAVDEIVAAAGKLKVSGEPVQSASFAMLKAATLLSQAAVQTPDDLDALWDLEQNVLKALRRFEKVLERAE